MTFLTKGHFLSDSVYHLIVNYFKAAFQARIVLLFYPASTHEEILDPIDNSAVDGSKKIYQDALY